MQDIREYKRDGSMLRDVLVDMETKQLSEAFAARRKAVDDRLESGETVKAEIRETRRIGRNDPCPCGSKLKFKKCCGHGFAANDERILP